MEEKVQEKLNQIRELAKGAVHPRVEHRSPRHHDSLSQAIRNAKEADMFLAELDAVIALAQKK